MARCIINTCGYRKIKGEDIFLMRVPTEAKFSEDWMKVFNSPPPQSIHQKILYIYSNYLKELYTSETSLAQKMVFNYKFVLRINIWIKVLDSPPPSFYFTKRYKEYCILYTYFNYLKGQSSENLSPLKKMPSL